MENWYEEVQSYARSRKREVRRQWGLARAGLASARGAHSLQPTQLTRASLIVAMANIELATALVDAWEQPRQLSPGLVPWFPTPRA